MKNRKNGKAKRQAAQNINLNGGGRTINTILLDIINEYDTDYVQNIYSIIEPDPTNLGRRIALGIMYHILVSVMPAPEHKAFQKKIDKIKLGTIWDKYCHAHSVAANNPVFAIELLQEILKIEPNNFYAMVKCAEIMASIDNPEYGDQITQYFEEALTLMDKQIQNPLTRNKDPSLDVHYSNSCLNYAQWLYKHLRYEECIEQCEEAMKGKKIKGIYGLCACAYLELWEKSKSSNYLIKAYENADFLLKEIDKKDNTAFFVRGKVQFELGNYDLALQDFLNSIEFGYNSHHVYLYLTHLYIKMGQEYNAIESFQNCIKRLNHEKSRKEILDKVISHAKGEAIKEKLTKVIEAHNSETKTSNESKSEQKKQPAVQKSFDPKKHAALLTKNYNAPIVLLISKMKQFYENKEYAKVIETAKEALKINLRCLPALAYRAASYFALGEFDKALAEQERMARYTSRNYTTELFDTMKVLIGEMKEHKKETSKTNTKASLLTQPTQPKENRSPKNGVSESESQISATESTEEQKVDKELIKGLVEQSIVTSTKWSSEQKLLKQEMEVKDLLQNPIKLFELLKQTLEQKNFISKNKKTLICLLSPKIEDHLLNKNGNDPDYSTGIYSILTTQSIEKVYKLFSQVNLLQAFFPEFNICMSSNFDKIEHIRNWINTKLSKLDEAKITGQERYTQFSVILLSVIVYMYQEQRSTLHTALNAAYCSYTSRIINFSSKDLDKVETLQADLKQWITHHEKGSSTHLTLV